MDLLEYDQSWLVYTSIFVVQLLISTNFIRLNESNDLMAILSRLSITVHNQYTHSMYAIQDVLAAIPIV